MIPAKRIFTAGRAGQAGRAGWSSFGGFDELVYCLRIVEGLSDRQARAHAPIELAAREELFVSAFCRNLAAVEHENAVRVAHGREAMCDDERRTSSAQPPERGEHNLLGNGVEGGRR